jgi:hypothetical protein
LATGCNVADHRVVRIFKEEAGEVFAEADLGGLTAPSQEDRFELTDNTCFHRASAVDRRL